MRLPVFSALFDLLDRVLERWDAASAARHRREALRRRAGEIVEKYQEMKRINALANKERTELAEIMRTKDENERCRLLVEFDARHP